MVASGFFVLPFSARPGSSWWRRGWAAALSAVLVAGLLSVLSVTAAPGAAAQEPAAGTGGYFTPTQGRVLDTRSAGGPLAAGQWRTVALSGTAAGTTVPGSGVSAVAITITAVTPSQGGYVNVLAADAAQASASTTQLVFNAGETVSSTALVAVSPDSRIQLRTNVSANLIIDLQGYFLTGNGEVAPGGYVPDPNGGVRLVDTRSGLGRGTNTAGARGPGSVFTVGLLDQAGIPATASAVFATVAVISPSGAAQDCFVTPYATGTSVPNTGLNFVAGEVTALASAVDLSPNKQFDIRVGPCADEAVHLIVDIQGYYDGVGNAGGFTPAASRVFDSRSSAQGNLAPGSVTKVKIADLGGIPASNDGVGAVAAQLTVVSPDSSASGGGVLSVWGTDQAEPGTSAVNISPGGQRGNLVTVAPGADDSVWVRLSSQVPMRLIVDTQGWYGTPNNLPRASNPLGCVGSGVREAQQQTSRPITDRASMSWNPTNGNLGIKTAMLGLPGISQELAVGVRYNALNDNRPTLDVGWSESSLRVDPNNGKVAYTAPDGACYVFIPRAGSATGFVKPAGINATLTRPDAGRYLLRFNPSGVTNAYTNNGTIWQLTSTTDVQAANTTTYSYSGNRLVLINDSQNRRVTFAYTDDRNPTQASVITDTSVGRSMTLAYGGPNGALSRTVDAAGDVLDFAYNANNKVTSVTDGRGARTSMVYDGQSRVASWTLPTVAGAAAVSRFTATYASTTRTTLRDPNANTATYTITRVGGDTTKITDPLGHDTTSAWSAHGDLTMRADGLSNATTMNQNGSFLTDKVTAPTGAGGGAGASSSATYPAASAADPLSNYRAMSTTDAQGKSQSFTYEPRSQNVATVRTPDDAGGTTTNTYQGQINSSGIQVDCGARAGQICDSVDGKGNRTAFGYDDAGYNTRITRPAPLSPVTMTYDGAGRMTSRTDGANTTFYRFDGNDRTTQVTYNTTTCSPGTISCVRYGYDRAGNLTSRVDSSGTTTFTFDAQNRVTRKQTVQGGTTTADSTLSYDPAGNMATTSDAGGTITYGYDAANRVTSLAEPGGSCPAVSGRPTAGNATGCTYFVYDDANRRTDTYYPNGRRDVTDFGNDSRPDRIRNTSYTGAEQRVVRTYGYTSGPMVAGQPSSGGLVDRIGAGTTGGATNTFFSYDGLSRLTHQGATLRPTDATATHQWSWDRNGNRTSARTPAGTTHAAFNGADQLCWTGNTAGSCALAPTGAVSYGYDGAGNQTATTGAVTSAASYTPADQLASTTIGGQTTGFTYADVRNDERTTAGNTAFTNGILGLSTSTTGTGNTAVTTQFVRDPAGTLIAMRTKTGTGAFVSHYYTADRQGSILLLTGPGGTTTGTYTYDAFGALTSPAPTGAAAVNPYRYTAGYTDPTGLIKMGARYYDPTLGRFTQPDPSGQETNTYLYAGANPTTFMDPTGLAWYDPVVNLGKEAWRYRKAGAVGFAGCYVYEAVTDEEDSWSDEGTDLKNCAYQSTIGFAEDIFDGD